MSEQHNLKKQLVRGAVENNVDQILGRYPNLRTRKQERQRGLLLPLALMALLISLPMVAAAVAPDWVERSAPWLHQVPGVRWLQATLHSGDPQLDPNLDHRAQLEGSPEQSTLTATASDQLEDLNLRFNEPSPIDRDVFELPVQRVILDPGHGGEHTGTSAGDLVEKEIVLDLGLRVRDLLESRGFEVFMTRVDDRDVELDDRVRFANQNRGDVFLSIHVNWLGDGTLRGIETFYLGASDDPEINRFAARENKDSGYSLTDFRRLLDGIYVDIRRDESRSFARRVHRAMVATLRSQNPNLRDRGVKQAPFMVLIGTEMPAILAEVSALNNREEARLLATDTYRASIAQALADGVVAYAESLKPGSTLPAPGEEASAETAP